MTALLLKEVKFDDLKYGEPTIARNKEGNFVYCVCDYGRLRDEAGNKSHTPDTFVAFYEWPKNPEVLKT